MADGISHSAGTHSSPAWAKVCLTLGLAARCPNGWSSMGRSSARMAAASLGWARFAIAQLSKAAQSCW